MNKHYQKLGALSLPFVGMIVALFFIEDIPIWDERLFMPTIKEFGRNYWPSIAQVKNMNSPMGPVFFTIWGWIGKILDFDLFWMRIIHISVSFGFILLLYRLFSKLTSFPFVACIVFIANPYFLVMTGPLLYTDITALIFAFAGIYFYLIKGYRFWAALMFGIAICTRQLLIILPLSMLITDLDQWRTGRLEWHKLWHNIVPAILFIPLFILWGYNVNSGVFGDSGQFEENTLKAFNFSFKKLNYSIILVGLYAIPFSFGLLKSMFSSKLMLYALPFLILLFTGFPVAVNQGLAYGNLPDTAGLLDIIFVRIGPLSYILIPVMFLYAVFILFHIFKLKNNETVLFLKVSLVVFIFLETIYSYCWDKHFLLVLPLIMILCQPFYKPLAILKKERVSF